MNPSFGPRLPTYHSFSASSRGDVDRLFHLGVILVPGHIYRQERSHPFLVCNRFLCRTGAEITRYFIPSSRLISRCKEKSKILSAGTALGSPMTSASLFRYSRTSSSLGMPSVVK